MDASLYTTSPTPNPTKIPPNTEQIKISLEIEGESVIIRVFDKDVIEKQGRKQLTVSKGTFEIKPLENFEPGTERDYLYTEMREVGSNQGWQFEGKHTKTDYFNRFDAMLENFADVAKGRKENPYSYDYELSLFKLLLKSCGK